MGLLLADTADGGKGTCVGLLIADKADGGKGTCVGLLIADKAGTGVGCERPSVCTRRPVVFTVKSELTLDGLPEDEGGIRVGDLK